MLFTDHLRREASYTAWHDRDGAPTFKNPFKWFRRQPRRTNSIRLESGLAPIAPATPRSPTASGHADHSPFSLQGSPVNRDPRPESSAQSTDPINVSANGNNVDEFGLGRPRKRNNLLGYFGRQAPDATVPDDSASSIGKQKFTPMSQLKATLFNSWINILLLAVPVGSKLFKVSVLLR